MSVLITIRASADRVLETLKKIEAAGLEWVAVKTSREHKTNAETAELVYDLYKKNLTVREIARRTGVSKSTVSKIAKRPSDYDLDRKPLMRQGVDNDQ